MTSFARGPSLDIAGRDAAVIYGRCRRQKHAPDSHRDVTELDEKQLEASVLSASSDWMIRTPRTSEIMTATSDGDHGLPFQLSGLQGLEQQQEEDHEKQQEGRLKQQGKQEQQQQQQQQKVMGVGPDPPPTPPVHSRAASSTHSVVVVAVSSPEQTTSADGPARHASPPIPTTATATTALAETESMAMTGTRSTEVTRSTAMTRSTTETTATTATTATAATTATTETTETTETMGTTATTGTTVTTSTGTTKMTRRSPATPPSQRNPPTPDVTPPAATSPLKHIDDPIPESSLCTCPPRAALTSPPKQAHDSFEIPPEHAPPLRDMGKAATTPLPPAIKSIKSGPFLPIPMQRTASAPSRPARHRASITASTTNTTNTAAATTTAAAAPSTTNTRSGISLRKISTASTSSWCTTSDARADSTAQKPRLLRHMPKSITLRDPLPGNDETPTASLSNKDKVDLARSPRPPQVARSVFSDSTSRRDDCASTLSHNTSRSISSNRARRDIWRSGGIPVVIVPGRTSSTSRPTSSSQGANRPFRDDASVRSATSSKRSGRNTTGDPVSASHVEYPSSGPAPPVPPVPVVFEQWRRSRRDRRNSEPERSGRCQTQGLSRSQTQSQRQSQSQSHDQRTVDFAPVIPARSSSLSAPTSRNVSRAPSVKSAGTSTRVRVEEIIERVEQHQASKAMPRPAEIEEQHRQQRQRQRQEEWEPSHMTPEVEQPRGAHQESTSMTATTIQVKGSPRIDNSRKPPLSLNKETLALANRLHSTPSASALAGDDELLLSPPLPPYLNTPYSVLSMETYATAPELSEALLVHMYPHQNSSVLLINNTVVKPSLITDKKPHPPRQELTPRMRMRRTAAAAAAGKLKKSPVVVTSPLKRKKLIDAHSPLRHPREPPRPVSASSSPARMRTRERSTREERPPRQLDLMKRAALTRRRQCVDDDADADPSARPSNFFARTLSLSRARRSADAKKNAKGAAAEKHSPRAPSQSRDAPPGADGTADPSFEDLHVHDIFGRGDLKSEILLHSLPLENRPPRMSTSTTTTTTVTACTGTGTAVIAANHGTTRRRRRRRSRGASTSGALSLDPITPPKQASPRDAPRVHTQHRQALSLIPRAATAADSTPTSTGASSRRRRSADSSRHSSMGSSPLAKRRAAPSYSFFSPPRSTMQSSDASPRVVAPSSFFSLPRFSIQTSDASPRAAPSSSFFSISRPGGGAGGASGSDDALPPNSVRRRFSIGGTLGEIHYIPHMLREKRREKRTQKLRMMISAPREVRDSVGEVIQRGRGFQQPIAATHI